MFELVVAGVTALLLFGILAWLNHLFEWKLFDFKQEEEKKPDVREEARKRNEERNKDHFAGVYDLGDCSDCGHDDSWSIDLIPIGRDHRKDRQKD